MWKLIWNGENNVDYLVIQNVIESIYWPSVWKNLYPNSLSSEYILLRNITLSNDIGLKLMLLINYTITCWVIFVGYVGIQRQQLKKIYIIFLYIYIKIDIYIEIYIKISQCKKQFNKMAFTNIKRYVRY